MNEQEIINGIRQGNTELFKEFILMYQNFVVNVCGKFLNDYDDANDAAQEVFIEVYNTIGKFRGESSMSTWLYRIAVNKSLNILRSKRKYRTFDKYEGESYKAVPEESDSTPDSELINKERAEVLNNAIEQLPENQKAAFILSRKEQLSNKEIGEILHVSVKAVESLLDRAKKKLQKILINYYK